MELCGAAGPQLPMHIPHRTVTAAGERPMDAAALRELETPLKTRYRDSPDAALVTLRAEGDLDADGIACKVSTGGALVEVGLHPAMGGSGLQACSGDIVLGGWSPVPAAR